MRHHHEHPELVARMKVLVTGAAGSIGSALVAALESDRHLVAATDIDTLDVRDREAVRDWFEEFPPDLVFHLAGAKHAPDGERDPFGVAETNIVGTANLLAAVAPGVRVVMASTCKACDPETAYGATKLIAERMVLNAGGTVARFYNVPESSGNVFETWRSLAAAGPLPVTPCSRYFMPLESAVDLLLRCAELPSGRYSVDPGPPRAMADVAAEVYPGRAQKHMEPRRGDRLREPLCAAHERLFPLADGLVQVVSSHDSVVAPVELLAA